LRYVDQLTLASDIDAIADAYGRAIYDGAFVSLSGGDGSASDGVLGTKPSGQYKTADAATGALALMDMVLRHGTDANATKWQDAARMTLDHLASRAHNAPAAPADGGGDAGTAGTGMYYTELVPSADVAHDALAGAAPNDFVAMDTQGEVALAFARALELVTNNAAAFPSFASTPLFDRVNGAIAAANAAPTLWDPTATGFFKGYADGTGTVTTTKTVRGNAMLFAALHRINLVQVSPYDSELKPLRSVMTVQTPAHAGFLAMVGNPRGYIAEATAGFDFVAGDGGSSASATKYSTAATLKACEGLNEQLVGVP
jgi:hypothetical protein